MQEHSLFTGPSHPEHTTGNMLSMVMDTAQQNGQRIAMAYCDKVWTYQQLTETAFGMGLHLKSAFGVQPGQKVGLLCHPGPQAALAMLAIFSCGATYVPLNPDYPDDRLKIIVDDGQVVCVLADPEFRHRAQPWSCSSIDLPELEAIGEASPQSEPQAVPGPLDLAYVMYTSGSTGTPKGVPIYHKGVVSQMHSFAEMLPAGPDDRLLSLAALSFDISVLEHFLPWCVGAKLTLAPRSVVRSGKLVLETLAAVRPTILQATPATWRLLLEEGWNGSPEMSVLTGGEALSRRMANDLLERCKAVWNLYGPTETTIWASMQKVGTEPDFVPLGRPLFNTSICILNEQIQPVPFGQDGEICIGGVGLSPGYVGRPELTADRFVVSPLGDGQELVYRTGDRGRFHENGDIEYLGRMDFQVKLRGYRIELGEIESVLASHPCVRQGVVILREDLAKPQLVAYLMGEKPENDHALRAYLSSKLPEFMVPGIIVWMDNFILNVNGKVDRKQLPKPTVAEEPADSECVAPALKASRQLLGDFGLKASDDLFFHGLDSLGTAKLAKELEKIYGFQVPLDNIFQHRTLDGIEASLKAPVQQSSVVELFPPSDKTPIYLLSTLTGSVPQDLATELGRHAPVRALRTIFDAATASTDSMTSLARQYVADIRATHDLSRPLHMVGFSFGGHLALEIAQQWKAEGGLMGKLFILDSEINDQFPRPALAIIQRVIEKFSDLAVLLSGFLPNSLVRSGLWKRLTRYGRRKRYHRGIGTGLTEQEILGFLRFIPGFEELPERNRQIAVRNYRLCEGYMPKPYTGEVVLIRRTLLHFWQERCLGWSRLGCSLTQVQLDTVVHEVLTRENYPMIADVVSRSLKSQ
jgi:amino acid adenylation domain-containing protein